MYTIRQAAARAGLHIPTVRAWERRYDVVAPERTASGYRLYDDRAIDRLIAMRHLVEHEGMRPSQAAERLRAAGDDLEELLAHARAHEGNGVTASPGAASDREPGRSETAVGAFMAAARSFDVEGMERVLDDAFAAERFEAAVERVVFPALHAIGDGWADGSIDVAMEHAASETIRRRLTRFDAAMAPREPQVVVGMPPDGHHELGALAFAVAARRRGIGVLYLGADVPLRSWVTAVQAARVPVAVIGVVGRDDVRTASEVVVALRSASPAPTVLVGGTRAGELQGVRGATSLPASLAAAVDVVQRELDAAG